MSGAFSCLRFTPLGAVWRGASCGNELIRDGVPGRPAAQRLRRVFRG